MKLDTLILRASVALIAIAVITWLWPRAAPPVEYGPDQVSSRIQRFTWARLAAVYPAGPCETSEHVSYAREPGAEISDHWYISSQLMADIALARAAPRYASELSCPIEREFSYLEQLWNESPPGGYFPRSDLDGSNPTTRDIYADDNAIAGIAMLDAADYVTDPQLRTRMERGAERAARYLIESGLWDDTYGGGFWWNSQREASEGGKPVQTAGLAVQLFARLYRLTANDEYRHWAEASMQWSDEWLYEPSMGLYRYGFRDEQRGLGRPPTFVNYDQGIMIEAHLAMLGAGDTRVDHIDRARTLAENIERFRSPLGGYLFELGVPQTFSHYSAWTSSSLLTLYSVDADPRWLSEARESLRDLNTLVADQGENGVYYGAYECIPRWASLCPSGASSAVDHRTLHLSQSWTQRAYALLARAQAGEGAQPAQ